MPYVVRNLRPRASDSFVEALRAERRTARGLALWAVAILCLIALAGHLADFSDVLALAF